MLVQKNNRISIYSLCCHRIPTDIEIVTKVLRIKYLKCINILIYIFKYLP